MDNDELGKRVRQLRKEASISSRDLATQVGVSPGFISLLERGKSSASLATLRGIASALGKPLGALLDGIEEPSQSGAANGGGLRDRPVSSIAQVVRRSERKGLVIPGSFFKLELLSPDLQGQIEFILIELEPGHPPMEPKPHIRSGEECALVIQGTLGLTVGQESWVLEAGDSVRFDPAIPHRIENLGKDTMIQISAITPPSF